MLNLFYPKVKRFSQTGYYIGLGYLEPFSIDWCEDYPVEAINYLIRKFEKAWKILNTSQKL